MAKVIGMPVDKDSQVRAEVRTLAGRNRFIFGMWDAFAPWGYGAFLQAGRGAVVLRGDKDGPKDELPRYWPLPIVLEDLAHPPAGVDAAWLAELAEALRAYDPELEIVVVLAIDGFGHTQGRYRIDDAAPRDLWLALRANDPQH